MKQIQNESRNEIKRYGIFCGRMPTCRRKMLKVEQNMNFAP